tara:strand:+ start:14788 stop:14922 length:135 start_codon:yes stop_codon:yes gene_type:complete
MSFNVVHSIILQNSFLEGVFFFGTFFWTSKRKYKTNQPNEIKKQ